MIFHSKYQSWTNSCCSRDHTSDSKVSSGSLWWGMRENHLRSHRSHEILYVLSNGLHMNLSVYRRILSVVLAPYHEDWHIFASGWTPATIIWPTVCRQSTNSFDWYCWIWSVSLHVGIMYHGSHVQSSFWNTCCLLGISSSSRLNVRFSPIPCRSYHDLS